MVEIQNLLTQAARILEKANIAWQESRLRGEQFNIFHVCGVNHYETIHSAIIAEFLNPNGSHGQGDVFLKEFLAGIKGNELCSTFDTLTASVTTEFAMDNGRIDIFITNASGQTIIIENKVYADDQWEQLKRYNEYALKRFHTGNYSILYLTLWGNEASTQSGEGVNYTCISYKDTILQWLERCMQIAIQKPLIRETLIQYANLIKELTNQTMDAKDKNELLELMANNAEAVAAICNMQGDYFEYVCKTYIQPRLKELAEELGFEYRESDNMWSDNKYLNFNFIKKHLAIYFEAARGRMYDIYYGFDFEGIERPKLSQISIFGKANSAWPYGFAYLDQYRYWDMNTLADILKDTDKFVNYIKQKIQVVLDELSKQGIELD